MRDHATSSGDFSFSQTEWISLVRRLAYDIEDCIDRFDAKKTTFKDFAEKLAELKVRSEDMTRLIEGLVAEQNFARPVAQGAIGTVQQVAIVPTAATKLQNVPGDNLNCLLYLCLFPPNHDVRPKPLIRRWLAEGLVKGEDVANDNLRFLIDSRYMSSIQTSNNGKVKRCKTTQETLEDISQRSISEKFILLCDGTAQLQEEEARRLSVRPSANVQLYLPDKLPCLRTLAVFPPPPAATAGGGHAPASHASYEDALDFARYEVLRVLDLKECAHLSDGHIQAICKQVLMRYLSMNLGSIDRIERKIGHLEQLETLDLTGSQTVTVFKEVLLLPKLKHLLGKFQLSRIDTVIDTYIPRWLVKSRQHKFLSQNESKLETLAGFVTNDRPGFPQLMSLMRRLRKVKIWCEPNASEENLGAISRAIWKFSRDGTGEPHSRSLTIDFQGCVGQFLNTKHPLAANGVLDSLKLRGHLSVFPKFVQNLSVIQELCLWSTGLSWQHIRNGLSKVSGLKYLKIIDDNLGVFVPALDIAMQADALPDLVSLHIICPNLDILPRTPGIKIAHMKNLKEVALHHQVASGIRTEWQQAVNGHTNRPMPILLFIQGP